jgi:putative PIN family toxin of toxin-antitoxin system
MKNKRIILDTNLWISFLISKNLSKLDPLINAGEIKLLFSKESIEEFVEVVERPKFKRFFSIKDIEKILNLFDQFGELIVVKSKVNICRDEKDNFLLNLSIDGKADYLITGDKDLLILKKIERTKILTIKQILDLVQ